ncbi:uncharacterized protein DS421_19g655310 [Arachis hypogaea]|uniref:Uncharacterized protein n=1 Tax=Arachis hypogaea TaxID=3818 RepID=A0A6B9V7M1_ARAHY|nr:uncharacterized protein DS421_19g655310 [Arachis hypogaea]
MLCLKVALDGGLSVGNPGLVNPSYRVMKHPLEPSYPSLSLYKNITGIYPNLQPLVPSLVYFFLLLSFAFFSFILDLFHLSSLMKCNSSLYHKVMPAFSLIYKSPNEPAHTTT